MDVEDASHAFAERPDLICDADEDDEHDAIAMPIEIGQHGVRHPAAGSESGSHRLPAVRRARALRPSS